MCALWIMPAFGMCPFIPMLIISGSTLPTISCMVILAILAVHGAYRIESQRRKEWKLLQEQHVEIQEQEARLAKQSDEIQDFIIHVAEQQQEISDFVPDLGHVPHVRNTKH